MSAFFPHSLRWVGEGSHVMKWARAQFIETWTRGIPHKKDKMYPKRGISHKKNVRSISTSCTFWKVLASDLWIKLTKYPNKEHTLDWIWLAPIGHAWPRDKSTLMSGHSLCYFPNVFSCNPFMTTVILYSPCLGSDLVSKGLEMCFFSSDDDS